MADQHALQTAMHQNYTAFKAILPELMKTHAGMFALMRDGQIVQFFNSDAGAMAYGDESFEDGVFSILEISDQLVEPELPEATLSEDSADRPGEVSDRPEPAAPEIIVPRAIVFASQKGGAGKTTLCGHVAVQAELAGAGPVALVDTDPQGSLAEWWNSREAETPLFVKTHFADLGRDLNALGERNIKLVFIDTPPAVTDTIREVVGYADLVVIPTRPSPHDLRAVGATVDIIEDKNKQLIFAVNAATARARITGEAAVALSQHGTVAPVTVHQRIDFATSMIDGRTVMEMNPESRSAQEIIGLWEYIATQLAKVERRVPERRVESRPYEGTEQRQVDRGPAFGRRVGARTFGKRVGR